MTTSSTSASSILAAEEAHDHAAELEVILGEVGRIMSLKKRPTISEAKHILRNHRQGDPQQGVHLATKLGRISRLRNTSTHDGMGEALVRDISAYLQGVFHDEGEGEDDIGKNRPGL